MKTPSVKKQKGAEAEPLSIRVHWQRNMVRISLLLLLMKIARMEGRIAYQTSRTCKMKEYKLAQHEESQRIPVHDSMVVSTLCRRYARDTQKAEEETTTICQKSLARIFCSLLDLENSLLAAEISGFR
jgi:hypothetical protein